MSFFTDPLYGLLTSVIVTVAGFAMGWLAEIKWGWLVMAVGLYWLWIVLGAQSWGIPAPPWSPF